MTDDDDQPPTMFDNVDRVFELLDEMERILKEIRQQAQTMIEQDPDV
jgi:hypothetical protein